jgi:hypothetical protein
VEVRQTHRVSVCWVGRDRVGSNHKSHIPRFDLPDIYKFWLHLKSPVFWSKMSCGPMKVSTGFEGIYHFHLQGRRVSQCKDGGNVVPTKYWTTFTGPYGVIFQKTQLFNHSCERALDTTMTLLNVSIEGMTSAQFVIKFLVFYGSLKFIQFLQPINRPYPEPPESMWNFRFSYNLHTIPLTPIGSLIAPS